MHSLQWIRGQRLIKRRSRLKVAGKKDAVDVRAFERNLSNGLARSSSFYFAAATAKSNFLNIYISKVCIKDKLQLSI